MWWIFSMERCCLSRLLPLFDLFLDMPVFEIHFFAPLSLHSFFLSFLPLHLSFTPSLSFLALLSSSFSPFFFPLSFQILVSTSALFHSLPLSLLPLCLVLLFPSRLSLLLAARGVSVRSTFSCFLGLSRLLREPRKEAQLSLGIFSLCSL